MNPICITGAGGKNGIGSAGEDGSGISFIYKRSIDGEPVTNPGAVTIVNGVPEVPVGWNDHPSGVTKEVPYEYCSCVVSNKGKWGTMWSEPFLWSHFGQNGMDGDGVEYIYYVALIAPTNNLPETWTDDKEFQNNEYIRYGSGWTDNPQDLGSEEFGPGYKQWVSVRKKYSDNDGQDPYWHEYSSPALWSYYSKDGVTYSLQLSNISLSYAPADQNYSLQMSFNVNLYKNESSVNNVETNLYMQLNSNSRTSLQYDSDHWNAAINTTVQSKSSAITIYAYNTNGAYLTSMTIPVSASGQKGDKGDARDRSVGQTFKGSPLRIVGAWQSGKEYYDGKRDAQDGIFYQDVVLYENMYYVCINTEAGNDNGWNLTPDIAGYWQKFAVTENFVADKIIANQAYVKELSSEEVVIMDGDAIVAGMTSSKTPDSKSDLNGKVENKGDVRIWAGEISNADLTTAPFTVTSAGELKSTKANITGQVNATSGSIGNLSITGRMTGDSTGGYLVIDGSSVALYGDDDNWSDGSRIKFYASNSQARGLISGMTGDTDSVLTIDKIGSGLDAHSGYGPCLRLNAEFMFDRVLDLNGTVTGLCRDQRIYDFSKTPKPTEFFNDNSSLYVFNNLTQEITVPLVDDFLGREFQIVNLSRYDIRLQKPSSIRMFVSSDGMIPIVDALTLKPYTTVHAIQSYDQDGSCLYFYY